jgi:electron transport complex protein RnfG
MKKLKSTLPNILLSLTGICLVAGAALSAANRYTEQAIAASKAAELQQAVSRVTPEFDNIPTEEAFRVAAPDGGDSLTVYPARKGGVAVGYAVASDTKNGFSGLIRLLVGFDADGRLFNYSVLEHNETPGLGSKMEEWFRQDRNRQSIIGYEMAGKRLRVAKDGGEVDAITAATISSRAFLEAVNRAWNGVAGGVGDAFKSSGGADATSGATSAPADAPASAPASGPASAPADTDATGGATVNTDTDNLTP